MPRAVSRVQNEEFVMQKALQMCHALGVNWYYYRPLSCGRGYCIKCEHNGQNISNRTVQEWERIARLQNAYDVYITTSSSGAVMTVGNCMVQSATSGKYVAPFVYMLLIALVIALCYSNGLLRSQFINFNE